MTHAKSFTIVRSYAKAFTLIELLVVISIIALLISILLPSLGKARETALNVICQNNLRQIGVGIQMYLDDQRDPTFLDLYPFENDPRWRDPEDFETNPFTGNRDIRPQRWNAMRLLEPYFGGKAQETFDCPAARGASSVLDEAARIDMQQRFMVHVLDYDEDGVEEYSEYWFNDSHMDDPTSLYYDPNLGVSGQKMRRIHHPEELVLAADALDWIPRHRTRVDVKIPGQLSTTGASNLLRGDLRVQQKAEIEYVLESDKYGSIPTFYNWGHFYPDN